MSETTGQSWPQRVRDARAAKETAAIAYEQTIRDAKYVGGMSALGIAGAIGITDRVQITKYLRATAPSDVPPVRLPVVLSLHGPGNRDREWELMRSAVAARGWLSADDTSAWHLSRAGATTVQVWWSPDQDTPDRNTVRISLVRAVHSQPADPPLIVRVIDYLPTAGAIQMEREHPEVADWWVQDPEDRSVQWRVLADRADHRPYRDDDDGKRVVDVDTILARVAELIDQD